MAWPATRRAKSTARVGEITPQGGTNLAAALDLGYQTALRHYQAGSINRVVLLTDGAANLGDVNPDALKQKVEAHRKQGIALDCFGIGWEGYDDRLARSALAQRRWPLRLHQHARGSRDANLPDNSPARCGWRRRM